MNGNKENLICVILKAYDHGILDSTVQSIVKIASDEKVKVIGPVPMPTYKKIWTVIRGPHIDKESREQFERREHKRLFYVKNSTLSFINAIGRLDLPSGVHVEIKLERERAIKGEVNDGGRS